MRLFGRKWKIAAGVIAAVAILSSPAMAASGSGGGSGSANGGGSGGGSGGSTGGDTGSQYSDLNLVLI